MDPEHVRTDVVAGPADLPDLIATNYRCGHCSSEIDMLPESNGMLHLAIRHDDGCPVLAGTLSALPDALRALVPDTFRAGR